MGKTQREKESIGASITSNSLLLLSQTIVTVSSTYNIFMADDKEYDHPYLGIISPMS